MQKSRALTNREIKLLLRMIKEKSDNTCYVNNPCLGRVYLPYGTYGDIKNPENPRGAYGYEHIIQKRYEVDKLTGDELSGLIILVLEAAKSIDPKYRGRDRYMVYYKGIVILVQKNFLNGNGNWIITGYPEFLGNGPSIKKEARDSIQSGIEQYRYFPEFSDIRIQIGALISSIGILRKAFDKVKIGKK